MPLEVVGEAVGGLLRFFLLDGVGHLFGWIFYQTGWFAMKLVTLGRFYCERDEYGIRLGLLGFAIWLAIGVGIFFLIAPSG